MRPVHLVAILVLLVLALPASPAHAGGVVGVCDESHLLSALADGGTVTFACSGTITLTTTIIIAANTTIDGSGQAVTLSGGNAVRLFKVNSGVTLTLDRLTVANAGNSAIYLGSGAAAVIRMSTFTGNAAPSGGGGAIFVTGGSLTVTDSTFMGNTGRIGGAIYGDGATLTVTGSRFTGNGTSSTDGGAITSSDSALTVTNCSFEGNSGSEGGAIEVDGGTATVTDSTFSGNSAGNSGGAFYTLPGSVVVIDKSTINQNRASIAGGGIYNENSSLTLGNSTVWSNLGTNRGGGLANVGGGTVSAVNSTIANNGSSSGGGIYSESGTVTLKNTIVANSSSGGNCSGTITNGGSNISYPDTTCPGANADPRLDSPQNNRGPTKTMSPAPGSAAIDAGDDAICAAAPVNNLDQRGITRAGQGAHCDIGAYEVAYYRVTKTQDDNGECAATDCSLREAIMVTNTTLGHDGIVVPPGTYPLTIAAPAGETDWAGVGDLDITDDLTILGGSKGSPTQTSIIHQSTSDRVFQILQAPGLLTTVRMSILTIENGSVLTNSALDAGGGILNLGELTLFRCKVQQNTAGEYGGGVASGEYSLTVQLSTLSGNSAGTRGGGIYNYSDGVLTVTDSTFSGNRATLEDGGGIYNVWDLFLSNSTFSDNAANRYGGGIANTGYVKMTNSTFSGNRADQRGGGFYSDDGNAEMTNCTFSGNGAPIGGGIYAAGSLLRLNTLVANSTAGGNCAGAITTGSGNLSYPDATCGGINRNPLLGALANNGGSTQTMALGAGSAAIDAGNSAGCQNAQLNNRDQRGYTRFVDGNGDKVAACDIGAFEYGASGPPTATLDPDPPEVSIGVIPAQADGANDWYRSPVTVTPQPTDASPVIDLRCALDPAGPPTAFDDLPEEICPFIGGAPVTADGLHTFYAAAMDIWGNKSTVVSSSFRIDATPPVLTCPAAGPFLLHSGDQPVGPAGVDASVSGLDEAASTLSGVVATDSVGPKTLTFTAVDLAGNTAGLDCAYSVIYDFGGFYPPVEPAPALNEARAGQAIPLKFSLAGDQGLEVIAEGYPASQPVACDTLEPAGDPEPTQQPGGSGLSYDPESGWYHIVWKTDKAWAGACRALTIGLVDGTEHQSYFRF